MSRALALASMFLVAGCGAAPRDDTPATREQPITAGVVEPSASGVVGVLDLDLSTLCSGVLVTNRVVVTARHCVAPASLDNGTVNCNTTRFGAESGPSRVVVATSQDDAQPTDRHAVARVIVPDDDGFCDGDLAVLVLAQPLDPAVAKPIPLHLDSEVEQGEVFSAIGIGRTETDPSGTRHRRDGLHVQCVGERCNSAMIGAHEWWGEGAVCEGDSGGPAVDDAGMVAGIASRKRSGCSATIYSDIASNSAFLRSALGEEKTTPTQPDVVSCSSTPGRVTRSAFAVALLGFFTLVARALRARPRR